MRDDQKCLECDLYNNGCDGKVCIGFRPSEHWSELDKKEYRKKFVTIEEIVNGELDNKKSPYNKIRG